jgi:hypothetical protein
MVRLDARRPRPENSAPLQHLIPRSNAMASASCCLCLVHSLIQNTPLSLTRSEPIYDIAAPGPPREGRRDDVAILVRPREPLCQTPRVVVRISGRGAGRYIRFDPWSWLSLQRAQA